MTVSAQDAKAIVESDAITSLDVSMFDKNDILNLILQRSEILYDLERPGRIIRAWSNSNNKPAGEVIDQLGSELIRRTIAFIYLEYQELRSTFDQIPMDKVADIGCGYAIFDLFAARDYGSDLLLIDLETNEHRHFGFESEGSAYSDLSKARAFLTANGIKDSKIETMNPTKDDVNAVRGVSLAASFISCGFHYPWETYDAFYTDSVKSDGSIMVDIRNNKSAGAQEAMSKFGTVSVVEKAANGKADRLLIRKKS